MKIFSGSYLVLDNFVGSFGFLVWMGLQFLSLKYNVFWIFLGHLGSVYGQFGVVNIWI